MVEAIHCPEYCKHDFEITDYHRRPFFQCPFLTDLCSRLAVILAFLFRYFLLARQSFQHKLRADAGKCAGEAAGYQQKGQVDKHARSQ